MQRHGIILGRFQAHPILLGDILEMLLDQVSELLFGDLEKLGNDSYG